MSRWLDRLHPVLCVAFLAAAGLPIAAAGQTVDVDAATTEKPAKAAGAYLLHAGYDHMFETDVKNVGGADVSRDAFQAGIGGVFDLGTNLSLDTRFIYELNHYDFSNSLDSIAWENINQYTLLGLLNYKVDDKLSLLGGPVFRLAGEGAAAFHNGFTGGGVAGFNYTVNEDLSLGLALGVMSQIEDDPGIVPIPMLRWHMAEPLTLRVGILPLGGRTGLGPELTWSLSKELDLGIGAQYQRRRFRMDDHGFSPTKKGVGEDTSAPFYARLTWRPMEAASVELFTGVVAAGELTIQDRSGDHTIDKGYQSTPILGLRGQYRF
jgi:hypothetical protein